MNTRLFINLALVLFVAACGSRTPDTTPDNALASSTGTTHSEPRLTADDAEVLHSGSADDVERILCQAPVDTDDRYWTWSTFSNVLHERPALMDHPFSRLLALLQAQSHRSKDGRLRVITCDTPHGRPDYDYDQLVLLKDDRGRAYLTDLHTEGEEWFTFITDSIYSLPLRQGGTLYLTQEYGRYSGMQAISQTRAWRISGDSLAPAKVFPHAESHVWADYWMPDWYDRANDGEGWGWLFSLEGDDLYCPLYDDHALLIDRYTRYHWNGATFDSVGEAGNPRLHASLTDYAELVRYFRTQRFRVRIDRMADGSFRYASWPIGGTMADKPDLVVGGGRYDEDDDCHVFTNNGYTYHVGYMTSMRRTTTRPLADILLVVTRGDSLLLLEEKKGPADVYPSVTPPVRRHEKSSCIDPN